MRRFLPVFALVFLFACSASSGGGGGGVYIAPDVKGCDAPTAAGCIGFNTDTKGGETVDGDVIGGNDGGTTNNDALGTDKDATGSDDIGIDDSFSTDDAGDLDGFFDNPDTTTDSDTGGEPSNCNERAKIVYVVSKENKLLSFTPDTLTLKVVGTLNCNVSGTPFSMSVDRQANAWVLYQGGTFTTKGLGIFKVSTLDASCQSTTYVPNSQGIELFGMGFSSDGYGSQNETLYIAGASASTFQTVKNKLGSIAFPGMGVTSIGTIDFVGGADLTGNGKGELFGFFPDGTSPSVRQIDKTNAKATTLKSWPLPASVFSNTQAWAFAQWGGDFYLFFQSIMDPSTNVWKLNAATGVATQVMTNIGYTITGAGVSSCAPTGTSP